MASAAVQESPLSASAALVEPRPEHSGAQEEEEDEEEEAAHPLEVSNAAELVWAAANAAQRAESQEAQSGAAAAEASQTAQLVAIADASHPSQPLTPAGASRTAQPMISASASQSTRPVAAQATQGAGLQSTRTGASVSVGFQPTETILASEAPCPNGERSRRSLRSVWRWPEEPGKLPSYVQRAFRLKAFSLVFAQLSICLAGSIVVKEMDDHALVAEAMMSSSSFWILCAVSVVFILLLYFYRQSFPVNYLLLVVNTISITFTWSFGGMSGVLFKEESHLHLQVLGIMVIAVFVTALVGHALSICKAESEVLVPISFLVGWLMGALANLVFLSTMEESEDTPFVAAGITFLLYFIVLIDVGGKLVSGNPDNFMRIIISCDSTLLVITSIPFLVLSFCLVRSFKHADERERRAAADQERA